MCLTLNNLSFPGSPSMLQCKYLRIVKNLSFVMAMGKLVPNIKCFSVGALKYCSSLSNLRMSHIISTP